MTSPATGATRRVPRRRRSRRHRHSVRLPDTITTVEDNSDRHRVENLSGPAVVVRLRVRRHQHVEAPNSLMPQAREHRPVRRAGVHEDGVAPVLKQGGVALTDVQE